MFRKYIWSIGIWAPGWLSQLSLFFFKKFFFFKDFIYSWETQTQAEGEAGSPQGAQCRTWSQNSRIMTWAKGRHLTAEPPRCPSLHSLLNFKRRDWGPEKAGSICFCGAGRWTGPWDFWHQGSPLLHYATLPLKGHLPLWWLEGALPKTYSLSCPLKLRTGGKGNGSVI